MKTSSCQIVTSAYKIPLEIYSLKVCCVSHDNFGVLPHCGIGYSMIAPSIIGLKKQATNKNLDKWQTPTNSPRLNGQCGRYFPSNKLQVSLHVHNFNLV